MRDVGLRALFPFSLALLVGLGCAGAELHAPLDAPSKAGRCAGAALPACGAEVVRAQSRGEAPGGSLDAYVAGLTGPWVEVARALRHADGNAAKPRVVLLGARADASTLVPGAPLIDGTKAGAPPGLDAVSLVLALAASAGSGPVVFVDGERISLGFPADPMASMALGLRPILPSAGPAALSSELRLAGLVRSALEAASRFDYVAAARFADELSAALEGAAESASVARARLALRQLDGAAIGLERTERSPEPQRPEPAPSPADTPYAHLLFARIAASGDVAWRARREGVLAALAEDHRAAADEYFAALGNCPMPSAMPPMDSPADLMFGWSLVASPLPEGSSPEARRGAVEAWLGRYARYAELVEQSGTAWLAAPLLLMRRGETLGLSTEGTPSHERVTRLAAAHIEALDRLAAAEPRRFRAMELVALAQSPGVARDGKLAPAMVALTRRATEGRLAAARSASELATAALTVALGSLSQPGPASAAQLETLDRALHDALHGPLRSERGWAAAGVYAGDAAVRLLASRPVDLGFAATEIERALQAESTWPRVAVLATVAARYAGLAAEGKLDPEQRDEARFGPERKAAKDSLRRALAGLGAPGEAPPALVDDLATLVDGLLAIAAFSGRNGAEAQAVRCDGGAPLDLPPAVARSLAKLGDVRRRVLASPRLRSGKDPWSRRARVLALVLSDTVDVLQKRGTSVVFLVSDADAARYLTEALVDVDERAAAEGIGAAYGLVRGFLASEKGESFLLQSGASWQRLFGAIAGFLREGGSEGSARLFETMSTRAPLLAREGGAELTPELVAHADALYAAGQRDHGELLLVAALAVGAARGEPLPARAFALADAQKSRASWAMQFEGEVTAAAGRRPPEPARFAEALRGTADLTCEARGAEPILEVFGAMKDFAAGNRAEARRALDRWLEDGESRGLVLPKVSYRFEETGRRVFQVQVDLSFGAGLIQASSFQLGLGVRASGETGSALSVVRGPSTDEEAARYYVHVAALAAAYHFLDGDPARGARDAQRVLTASLAGVRLGSRSVPPVADRALTLDARATIALVAQLAVEAKQPFLAGDLWTVVKDTLFAGLSDADVDEILAKPPLGFAGLAATEALLERTRRALRVLAEPLACTQAKVDRSPYDYPACELYPQALAFRVADATRQMPRLATTGSAAARTCGAEAALDRFLLEKERGTYDPDAFLSALSQAEAAGRSYEAAVLLTRLRAEPHCSAPVVTSARKLGRSAELGPVLRADLLTVAVNCGIAGLDDATVADLAAVDDALAALPDPSRGFSALIAAVDLAERTGRWDVLARFVDKPGFVARWTQTAPFAATAALLIDQATRTLVGKPREPSATAADVALFCETFPPAERAETCTWLRTLRAQTGAPEADRKASARSALRALLKQVSR